MKNNKTILSIAIVIFLVLQPINNICANAADVTESDGKECVTIETVIEEDKEIGPVTRATSSTKSKSGTKTSYMKNSAGEVMWYVRVSATFKYNGSTSWCTGATVTAVSNDSSWKISNKSSSYASNWGSAYATGKHYILNAVIQTINKSVTLHCSRTGTLS